VLPLPESQSTSTDGELAVALPSAIAALPDTHREVATLAMLHGQKIAEICLVLRIPKAAVKMRLYRARVRLRRALKSFAPASG